MYQADYCLKHFKLVHFLFYLKFSLERNKTIIVTSDARYVSLFPGAISGLHAHYTPNYRPEIKLDYR